MLRPPYGLWSIWPQISILQRSFILLLGAITIYSLFVAVSVTLQLRAAGTPGAGGTLAFCARVGFPSAKATRFCHFARYTTFPATIVHNTFVCRISSGETVSTSRSSRTKSARLPGAMLPIEFMFMARAEFRV